MMRDNKTNKITKQKGNVQMVATANNRKTCNIIYLQNSTRKISYKKEIFGQSFIRKSIIVLPEMRSSLTNWIFPNFWNFQSSPIFIYG